jgi:GNAT superfamily N-acetyltransferase
MPLTERELAIVQQGVDALTRTIAELGLTLLIERDFRGLAAFLQARGSFVNPSFDPDLSRLGWRDFWVHLLDPGGRSIACSAEKVIETDDFMEEVATGTIWYASGFAGRGGPERIEVLPVSAHLAGAISHSGSTWVDRAWRGQGLAMLMTRLSRALSFRNHGVVANTGFVRHSLYLTPVPTESYGYVHVERCLDGFFPPQNGPEVLYLCWITDREFVRSVEALPGHPRRPVPLEEPEAATRPAALARARG